MKITNELLDRIVQLARSFGVTRLILFGSALDTKREARDLDLACEGVHGWALFELGAAIEREFRIPLDLVPLDTHNKFTALIEKQGRRIL